MVGRMACACLWSLTATCLDVDTRNTISTTLLHIASLICLIWMSYKVESRRNGRLACQVSRVVGKQGRKLPDRLSVIRLRMLMLALTLAATGKESCILSS